MRAYERLIKNVQIHTTSDPEGTSVPSTERQFDLARELVKEMKMMGIADARVDEKCYVYGSIPASEGCENYPAMGFLAHLDTAPDFNGKDVKPQIIPVYDGGVVELGDSGLKLDPSVFPSLAGLKGRTLITTDGTSLLGADDKAGIAAIMTAAETLLSRDKWEDAIPHGKICLAFTPDEEIGGGAEDLDLDAFGAKYAFTLDGEAENEVEYETFNAASAKFDIHGLSIHPGEAKDKMINAVLLATEIINMLPAGQTPRDTEGYEGFFHLMQISGNVEQAEASLIVRDHDRNLFEERLSLLRQIEKKMNETYGEGTVALTIKEQYRNMAEKIRENMHLIDNAKMVMVGMGLEPVTHPVRGGTDGAQLSFRGLPCPNLGTGGHAFHGPYEHITVEGMDKVVEVILGIIYAYAHD
ncbi:MAG: peptidase T [Lachnospiraceae bacterium]|nr:peptidase T [Lachnospiraceae bacterium]